VHTRDVFDVHDPATGPRVGEMVRGVGAYFPENMSHGVVTHTKDNLFAKVRWPEESFAMNPVRWDIPGLQVARRASPVKPRACGKSEGG